MRNMRKPPSCQCLHSPRLHTEGAQANQEGENIPLWSMQTDGGNSFTEPMVIMTGRPEGQSEVGCRGLLACTHAAALDLSFQDVVFPHAVDRLLLGCRWLCGCTTPASHQVGLSGCPCCTLHTIGFARVLRTSFPYSSTSFVSPLQINLFAKSWR
jgi:hypothetical protein